MNEIVSRIKQYANEKPKKAAYTVYDIVGDKVVEDTLSWGQLDVYSNKLGMWISKNVEDNKPIVVYGHKSKFMLVCFLACIKSGHAYCPVDESVPIARVNDIIDSVNPSILLSTISVEHLEYKDDTIMLSENEISDICVYDENPDYYCDEDHVLKLDDVFYIIFTSGSTGKPKGVQITTDCLLHYLRWAVGLGDDSKNKNKMMEAEYRFLNQAPFSFDLSVMDVYLALFSGGTICALTKALQMNMKLLFNALRMSNVNVWVSTPSFADVCLSDKTFDSKLMPNIELFLFCGEILTNKTVNSLIKSFPDSKVMNTYGPTESTVCVTEILVDERVSDMYSPLPVGRAKPGTWLHILDEKGNTLPESEQGEIAIIGDTVSIGYFKNEEQTDKFFSKEIIDGKEYRKYLTGDKGYIKDGLLFYCGRMDFQIKLHGYRIEIEDIENNLTNVEGVTKAVVLPKYDDNNRVSSLIAYIVYEEKDNLDKQIISDLQKSVKSKKSWKNTYLSI